MKISQGRNLKEMVGKVNSLIKYVVDIICENILRWVSFTNGKSKKEVQIPNHYERGLVVMLQSQNVNQSGLGGLIGGWITQMSYFF